MEARTESPRQRDMLIAGFVLALIGAAALVSELWPDLDRYLPLAVGVGLLVVFAISRAYLALVGGSILSGLGIGLLASQLVGTGQADGAGVVLGLAGGFIAIWLAGIALGLKERHWWPLVPGTILLLVGSGLAIEAAGTNLPWLVPSLVLGLGLVVMAIGYLRTGSGQHT